MSDEGEVLPVVLSPTPDAVDLTGARVLIADVHDEPRSARPAR